MESIDLTKLERRARRKYEWTRARQALVGFAPSLVVVAIAALANEHPTAAIAFGAAMFAAGAGLLWYGREVRRAVLPGLAFGVLPLAMALCANNVGHTCMGGHCVTLCVPACLIGGAGAGIGVSIVGLRWKQGLPFWTGAAAVTLLTGAMGCSCVGWSGVAGMVVGFAIGMVPAIARGGRKRRQ